MADIFVSYRRDDSNWSAGRLNDAIAAAFGEERVFFDTVTIEPGDDFHEVLGSRVGACKVLLAVIGPKWLEILEGRTGDTNDFVRIEIAEAVRRNIRIVPVLIDGAKPPPASRLPDDIKILSRRQAVQVRADTFRGDAAQLIEFLKKFLAGVAKDETATTAADKKPKSPPAAQRQAKPRVDPFSWTLPPEIQKSLASYAEASDKAEVQTAKKPEWPGTAPKVAGDGADKNKDGKEFEYPPSVPLYPTARRVPPQPSQEQPLPPKSRRKQGTPPVDPKSSSSKAALNAHSTGNKPITSTMPKIGDMKDWSFGDLLKRASEPMDTKSSNSKVDRNANITGEPPTTPTIGGKDSPSLGDLLRRASEVDPREGPRASPPQKPAGAYQGVDIAALSRAIEPTTAEDVWRRIKKGERGVVSPSLLTTEGKPLFEKIKLRYREDPKFKPTVEAFLKEFEKALAQRMRQDSTSRSLNQLLASEAGRVYLLLAHLTGRL